MEKKANKFVSGLKCCISQCKKSKRSHPSLKMFRFPPFDDPMGQIWREKCSIPLDKYDRKIYICSDHFDSSFIGKKKLKMGAVPCVNIETFDDDYNFEDLNSQPENYAAAVNCSNCEKMAKAIDFYRKKYYDILKKHNALKLKTASKKKSGNLERVIDAVDNVSEESKVLSKLILTPRPQFYSYEVKNLMQNIYYVSQSTYKFLRNKLNLKLPHMRTVHRWAPIKSLQPGFKNSGAEYIKKKCLELPDREKDNIILLLDEMAIRPELRYNSTLDLVDGFVDDGFKRTNAIGKYVCVFMARSTMSNWGIVLNYFVPKTGFTGEQLKRLILGNIDLLKTYGANVKVVTCDQASSNIKCYTELGVSSEKPFFIHNERKIFCMYDFPHLIKSLRNSWLVCDIETLDGKVSFKVIEELLEIDSKNSTKLCPKLSFQHIYPNSFQKMRVKLATQIFSHTVEAAINTLVETSGFKKCSKEQASATAAFVEKIYK